MLKKYILVLSCSLFSAAHTFGEVQFLAETGFIVENKTIVKSSREETWNTFIDQVDQWWPADHTWWGESGMLSIDPVAGGCFCEKYENKSAEHMRVTFVEPNSLIRMTGGLGPLQGMGMYGALDWKFTDDEQGTLVTMTYKVNGINPGGFAELAPIVDMVQALQIAGLANLSKDPKTLDVD
jgi:uncharacterized protein YndB with AHSA1/START domain